MFKSRSGSQGNPATPPPQCIEAVRRRARHRLIGAAVLVLLGVLGFPLLFDTQPRPISVDIPIEIPAKNPVVPLTAAKTAPPTIQAAPVQPGQPEAGANTNVTTNDSLSAREEVVETVRPAAPPAKQAPVPEVQPEAAKPAAQAPAAAKTSAAEAARAKALLEGKPAESAERIVVQVGAFADATRAREVRLTLERAGLKTYTHVAETPEGKRIRVRVGPFASKAEADKAAARVKALGLPAAILTL
ncbi:MAG: SPOR domain-containing protein [Hydrogenophaga sp.]|uniref:SPOR domain-containing protein n=1 Tax=Hydrogenophaga sp. TaxID=1904254 RepID=UPI002730509E|nr:SPOR domain-containing protein [Hydrogenophaga sp.]MDP2166242.1 SPOR domain-containing protein [Hydrogenophaga sp.]